MGFHIKLISALLLLATAGAVIAAESPRVYESRLENGMTLLVKPDRRAPVAISQVWYRVGSASEHDGISGISHVLEHMMFKGTAAHPAGEFSELIAAAGGKENAFTGRDYTAYYQLLRSDRLELALRLEADRMRNLSLPQEEFEKELNVVKEERLLRTEDDPEALTFEHFNAVAYLNSPYRLPVVGWMQDLDALTVEDLRAWYQRFYQPANAILVVVGDVDPPQVKALAKTYFGPIQSTPLPDAKPRNEIAQQGERRIRLEAAAKVPYLLMGYKVPSLATAGEEWEAYALDVLAAVLDGGRSARFSTELVRSQQVASAIASDYSMLGPYESLLLIEAKPAQGRSVAELEAAIERELEKLRSALVTTEELQRVKAGVIAAQVYALDSVQGQANQLGVLQTLGLGWQWLDTYPQRIKQVTAEQVRAVAQKYLLPQRRTVAQLVPLPINEANNNESNNGAAL